ncbi:MAG: DNA repair protein RecN [Actinobacteria bacterium]|uniref:DNA repair protein RecN n=1 Tax=freshwater metagenome TaxID=449393 RepID=A0A6J6DC95_9ZZZZ|nr:DNA repair protein RecN [Actinomycetota bacterium]
MSERTFLEEITIRSIGVIDQSTLEISKGLTVLSGETGAGKTMILTALNLILGGKSDSSLIRKGSERLVASGKFAVPKDSENLFEDLVVEDGQLIITRTVNSDGKSKATSNGVNVTAAMLNSVASNLVEVHAQSANQSISKSSRQRELLDRFAQLDLSPYTSSLNSFQEMKSRIAALTKAIADKEKELSALTEFSTAFSKLKPKDGEIDEINAEISRLSSVHELGMSTQEALTAISSEESGALVGLAHAKRSLEKAKEMDPSLEAIHQQISESFFTLDDANIALNSYVSSLEADPQRLETLHARKADLRALIKRYSSLGSAEDIGENLKELILKFANSADAIADLNGGDERLNQLNSELKEIKRKLLVAAQEVSAQRIKAADVLSNAVTKEIQALSMPHARFVIQVSSPDYNAPKESDFTIHGCDEISMFIQAHNDAPLVPIAKGASGGEMSRVMLALEVVIASTHPIGTYVFDEVDAGVGGKAAIEVGKRLHELSKHAQVIVVTHLPQVAAWADSHFVVTKNNDGLVSQSDVQKVEGESRVQEIARMLAGLDESSSAREHATELLALKV